MPVVIEPFRPAPNWDIMNYLKSGASLDYQSRVPDATKANIQESIKLMWDYAPTRNEFIQAFINKIGMTVARNISFTNPLGIFKIGMLEYGDTIEEYIVGLVTAKTYDSTRDSLEKDVFGQAEIDVQTSYHKVNRKDFYKVTVNEAQLKQAFLSQQGLSSLVVKIMAAAQISDQVDEFELMCSLFKEYWKNGGFFKVSVPDVGARTSTQADSNFLIRRIREFADTLPFVSNLYNPAGMPIAVQREELILITTPGVMAAADVESLAAAFNIEKGDFSVRTVIIPKEKFNIDGVQAILTTKDFFVVADQLLETRSMSNPQGLYDNFWLHHWQVISASRFVPAILFTSTEPDTVIVNTPTPVASVSALVLQDATGTDVTAAGKAERGQFYNVFAQAITNPAGGLNDAVYYTIENANAGPALSVFTMMTNTGTLLVSPDEDATDIKITAVATDDNTKSATLTLSVVGDKVQVWPNPKVDPDSDKDELFETKKLTATTVPAAPTSGANKNVVKIPTIDGVDFKDGATTVNGQTITLTANKTITAVAQAGWELATGSTTSWSLVYTA